VALTLLLYGDALALPLYSDDLLQVPWVEQTDLPDSWRTVGPYRDYRPLHFSLWKLLYLLTGDLTPKLLHGLNLAGHILCGTLVGLLAKRFWRSRLVAPLAAAFFVVFPSAFDAVPWAVAFSYPLATALALGALLTYLHAHVSGLLLHHLLAVLMTALAGFSYEGGVITGAMILLTELTVHRRGGRRCSPWPLVHLAASGLPMLAAALIRPQGTALAGLAWPDVIRSATYALQALVFPTAPLAGLLTNQGLNPVLAVVLAALLTLAAVGWGVWRGLIPGGLFLAFGWWALWCLPPMLALRFAWLSNAPRTLYPAAAGVALLWSCAVGGSAPRWGPPALVALRVILAVACLVPAAWFVAGRMALHRQAGDLLWEVVAAAEVDGPLLVVNLPSRITPPERLYPLGHEGIIPLPSRVGAGDLVAAHTGRKDAALERAWGPVLQPMPYAVQPLGDPLTLEDVRAAGRVALVVYRPDRIDLEDAGAVLSHWETRDRLACFGEKVALLSASCTRTGSGRVILSTVWRLLEPLEERPTVFAHLVGEGGVLLSQGDGDPLRGLYPFHLWRAGEVARDVRAFESVHYGPATVALGVWDPTSGARWKAVGVDGEPLPDDMFQCTVRD
jgi:hypothetical protein